MALRIAWTVILVIEYCCCVHCVLSDSFLSRLRTQFSLRFDNKISCINFSSNWSKWSAVHIGLRFSLISNSSWSRDFMMYAKNSIVWRISSSTRLSYSTSCEICDTIYASDKINHRFFIYNTFAFRSYFCWFGVFVK